MGETIRAVPFDLKRIAVYGAPVPVVDGVPLVNVIREYCLYELGAPVPAAHRLHRNMIVVSSAQTSWVSPVPKGLWLCCPFFGACW
ncbi:MAG: hypothetical protein ABI661_04875 [Gammaproteobacteria bacterium]